MKPLHSADTAGDEIDDTDAVVICDACPHPQDLHDAMSLRYCAATIRAALSRGCLCQGELIDHGHLRKSGHPFR